MVLGAAMCFAIVYFGAPRLLEMRVYRLVLFWLPDSDDP